ncbi:MAG: depupylase/deamidase Dop [Acidimicrobiales bacterium]
MAITKVCGIETEYGVQGSSPEISPVTTSSLLVNAYAAEVERRTGWDFEDESPENDARGFARDGAMAPMVETHLANTVLTNGARYYVDHAHPEYSTPECINPLELVCFDKSGEEVMRRSMRAAAMRGARDIVVYKNNSDGKGNSYGCHENYLMDRSIPFARIVTGIVPHFVSRQLFTGAGKVGTETPTFGSEVVRFQLSQRAEFFEEVVGLETTLKRPIVNTRDEPHADPKRFRRLHVIVGDANLAEVATFLKVGSTALVLAMIEDEILPNNELALSDPVRAMHQVSADLTLSTPLRGADGSTLTALDIQWEIFAMARKYAKERGLAVVGGEEVGELLLDRWEQVLHALESDPMSLGGQLDWVAKHNLIEAYRDRHGCGWGDRRLSVLDLQYHDLRPERSLFARLPMEHLVNDAEVTKAVAEPPQSTRAWFRGRCLSKWPDAVVSANWDSLIFDLGADPLRRVPMMDPLKGTADHTASLFEACETAEELLDRLSA